jgi:hypothetical protein
MKTGSGVAEEHVVGRTVLEPEAVGDQGLREANGTEHDHSGWADEYGSTGQFLASRLQMKPKARPVDVERGLFYLLECDRLDLAEQLLLLVT